MAAANDGEEQEEDDSGAWMSRSMVRVQDSRRRPRLFARPVGPA
eukprot:CAMPEP_0113996058 /NCGR_PEP_ID=MMETSP0328-20130328/11552_1 /TAXON_ID=39455 /ORGANISM="Alexandrium minutum" /LENGTH=43 /assembly_acc=CAM_ASM_000350